MENLLSILQYRDVINCIKETYAIDLSNYALTSLRRNIQNVINNSKYRKPEKFTEMLRTDRSLLNAIMHNLYSESIVMFRDPAMWRMLKQNILPTICQKEELKIWMPEVCIEEFYTLSVVLKDANFLHKSNITVTSQSLETLDAIRKLSHNIKEIEQVNANYIRYQSHNPLSEFIEVSDKKSTIKKELIGKLYLSHSDMVSYKPSYKPNLVLFRNRMLSYNHSMEQKALNKIYESMAGGGYLIVGIKEDLEMFLIQDKFRVVDKEESIYKRLY